MSECPCCNHPLRAAIDRDLARMPGAIVLHAEKYGVPIASLIGHESRHISTPLRDHARWLKNRARSLQSAADAVFTAYAADPNSGDGPNAASLKVATDQIGKAAELREKALEAIGLLAKEVDIVKDPRFNAFIGQIIEDLSAPEFASDDFAALAKLQVRMQQMGGSGA